MIASPGRGEADIWYLWPDRVTDEARLASHERLLTDDERIRTQAFHFPEHRHSHLLTRAFVRTLLSQYSDVKPEEWRFVRSSFGKPEISGPSGAPSINFSLSHTKGLIVCAVSSDSAIGIDAENVERVADHMEIAQRFFSPYEYRALQDLASSDRPRRFLEYWTLKESYVKARGLGLSLDLSAFSFKIKDRAIGMTFEPPDTEESAAWQFRLFAPGAHHIAAASTRCGAGMPARLNERDGTPLMQ
jgi:4'-phosphopantetheinyl transferase